jgi:hypothetical protein
VQTLRALIDLPSTFFSSVDLLWVPLASLLRFRVIDPHLQKGLGSPQAPLGEAPNQQHFLSVPKPQANPTRPIRDNMKALRLPPL